MKKENPQQYLPIRWGGLRVLFTAVIPFMVWFVLVRALPDASRFTVICLTIPISVVHALALIAFQNPIVLFSNYWQRNVLGHWLWCYRGETRNIIQNTFPWGTDIAMKLLTTASGENSESVAIGIPLGGWFRKNAGIYAGSDISSYLAGWRAEIANISPDRPVDVCLFNARWGDRMVLTIDSALKFLEYMAVSPGDGSLGGVVQMLLMEKREQLARMEMLLRLNTDLEQKFDDSEKGRNVAIETMLGIVKTLGDVTDTLKPNKVRRLRNRLAEHLLACLAEDDPRRVELAPAK